MRMRARGSGGRALTSLGGRDRPPLRPLKVVAKDAAPEVDLAAENMPATIEKWRANQPSGKVEYRKEHASRHTVGHIEHQIAEETATIKEARNT